MRKLTLEEVKERIKKAHNGIVTMVESTFIDMKTEAIFVDVLYKEWPSLPCYVVSGRGHPLRAKEVRRLSRLVTVDEVKKRLEKVHGDVVTLYDEKLYVNMTTKIPFHHRIHGMWPATPDNVLHGHSHPLAGSEKMKKTCEEKFGADNPQKNRDISLKSARNSTKSSIKTHWKTGEELVCQASWEPMVVDYFNENQIDFQWQPQVFKMPNGKTYRPDAYLPESDVWIEIKGRFIRDAKSKWDWFKIEHPTAELWDKKKLRSMGIKVK
jgi:hypothetical protein